MRVGMIGFGGIAHAHAPGWTQQDVDLHIVDIDAEARAEAARSVPTATVHTDLESLLGAVDVVDIVTPSYTHADLARQCARAGKQVICEKPIALTINDAADALRVVRDAGVSLHVGHVVRFFGEYAAAHAQVAAGALGTPAVSHFRRASAQPVRNTWMRDVKLSGGVPFDLAIHDLDQARWTSGEVTRVYAVSGKPGVGGIDTHIYAVLTHESGALSHITSSWGLAEGFETSFEIAGTEGLVAFDSTAHPPVRADRPELLSAAGLLPVMVGDSPFETELAEFARAIKGGAPARVTPADALAAVALAAAVLESLATGRPVDVPPVPDDLRDTARPAEQTESARGTW
ncbi:MAG: Gfo/Idh/MocA family protein [Mycobacteriales bacterium]